MKASYPGFPGNLKIAMENIFDLLVNSIDL